MSSDNMYTHFLKPNLKVGVITPCEFELFLICLRKFIKIKDEITENVQLVLTEGNGDLISFNFFYNCQSAFHLLYSGLSAAGPACMIGYL